MAFTNPTTPNLADFTAFCYAQGVPAADLPSNSDWLAWGFGYASNIALVPPSNMPAILYVMAVYQLGMHWLIKWAQDIPPYSFFLNARKLYGMANGAFTPGIVNSTSDQGTSTGLAVPQAIQNLTLQGLDLMRTPWGLAYLEYAQAYGPNVVEVS
jgi:hypothetical protein